MGVVVIDDAGASALAPSTEHGGPDVARQQLRHVLERHHIDPDLMADAELVLDVIATQVFSPDVSPGISVDIRFVRTGVTVTVSGRLLVSPAVLTEPLARCLFLAPEGRGLAVVNARAATWGARRVDDLVSVWFTISELIDDSVSDGPHAESRHRSYDGSYDRSNDGSYDDLADDLYEDEDDPRRLGAALRTAPAVWRMLHTICRECGLLIFLTDSECDELAEPSGAICWNCEHPDERAWADAERAA